ncbi:NAD(P)-binding protein [Lojkania enalia]|uniref:NAD(P)-binding protein n=1 Tax=Lojkania enalia TaxID=147567 RepID=A0A9P4JVT5_9PLEO|nr:NAD(P)-binding protein [Didymosphaeria enalia]
MGGSSPAHPVNCDVDFDTSNCAGKTAIVAGGANGLGEAYVRALASAGSLVCIADVDAEMGEKLASELPNKIHFVVANAGIAPPDDVFSFDGKNAEPTEPNLKTIDVNLCGVLYMVKLSLYYFVKQNGTKLHPGQEDTCLVLIGSGAAYFDVPRSIQYPATKWGMLPYCGSRVNMIAPCDRSINRRCLFISARKWAPRGYMDLDLDDYPEKTLLDEIQTD